jgi:hypothetical protein
MLPFEEKPREQKPMLRIIGLTGLALLLLAGSASAATYKEKLEICKSGATDMKLTGAKRNAFIHKCMGKGDYEPPGRTVEKKKPAMKKPPAKPATAPVPEPKPQ